MRCIRSVLLNKEGAGRQTTSVIVEDKPFTLCSLHDFTCILMVINMPDQSAPGFVWCPTC